MIFPIVRLSELRDDVAIRRLRLDESAAALRSSIVSQSTASTLLKHPGWIVGGLVSVLAAFKISKKTINLIVKSNFQGRLLAKVLAVGTPFLIRKIGPLATQGAMFALKQFTKKRRE